jgi:hypothetical protein
MARGPRAANGFGGLLGTVPAGGGGVRVIVELLLSLLAITYAIAKNAEAGKIMRCYTLPSDNSGSEHISAHIRGQSTFSSKISREHFDRQRHGRTAPLAGKRAHVVHALLHAETLIRNVL